MNLSYVVLLSRKISWKQHPKEALIKPEQAATLIEDRNKAQPSRTHFKRDQMENSTLRQETALPNAKVTHFPELNTKQRVLPSPRRLTVVLSLVVSDFLAVALCVYISSSVFGAELTARELLVSGAFISLFVFNIASKGHYSQRIPFWDQTKDAAKRLLFIGAANSIALSLLNNAPIQLNLIAAWSGALATVLLFRRVTQLFCNFFGAWRTPTVIVGCGKNAVETANALCADPSLGYDVICFLNPDSSDSDNNERRNLEIKGKRIPIRTVSGPTEKALRRLGSPHVVIALERGGINKMQSQVDRLILNYPNISVSPALRKLPLFSAQTHRFFSHEVMLLEFSNNLSKLSSIFLKRVFDIVISSLCLVAFSPVFLLLAYRVRKTGKSIIFAHTRVGQNGKEFKCYKFRTMVEDSKKVLEELLANSDEARREWYKDFKLKNDPRITPFGQFLRKSSLDELPQLWNVLKGDMSLVGPRPVVRDEIPFYEKYANFYYKAKPGLTGLWQVSGRNDIDYASRVELDVWYVSNWSLWNDIIILLKTVKVVCSRAGAY